MSNIFNNMLEQYEDSHKPRVSNIKKYDLKNYFSTYLKDGVNQATKKIRILPPQNGAQVPWTIKWGHKIQVDGDWKTYACLKHEKDEACPFCEAREVLLSSGIASEKELAKKYSARMMYVIKVIDRDNEEEGVKFWRFNHDYRKTGILDKLVGALKAVNHDISDPVTGRDLNIDVARDQNNRPVVQSISYPLESTPLSSDIELSTKWLSDTRTWHDVYSVRDYDYLAIVVSGEVPVFSKKLDKFVAKSSLDIIADNIEKGADNLDDDLKMGITDGNVLGAPVTTVEPTTQPTQPVASTSNVEDEDDDMPF